MNVKVCTVFDEKRAGSASKTMNSSDLTTTDGITMYTHLQHFLSTFLTCFIFDLLGGCVVTWDGLLMTMEKKLLGGDDCYIERKYVSEIEERKSEAGGNDR